MTEEGIELIEKVKLKGYFNVAGGGELWTQITYKNDVFIITHGDHSQGGQETIKIEITPIKVLEQLRKFFIQHSKTFNSKKEILTDKDILTYWEEWPLEG